MRIGIVEVACFAACAAGVEVTTIMSGRVSTHCLARTGNRSLIPSGDLMSIVMVLPSTYPNSRIRRKMPP